MKNVFALCLILVGMSLSAQDLILLNNDEKIFGEVLEITSDEVVFFRQTQPDGPKVRLAKDQILRIEYEDGRIEYFEKQKIENEKSERVRSPRKKSFEPQQFIVLGTGIGFAQSDLSTRSDEDGTKAKSGYNGELMYGYYPHENWGIDARLGVNFLQAEFETDVADLGFDGLNNIPGLESIILDLEKSSFNVAYFTLGPTARLPLSFMDIHAGIQGGLMRIAEAEVRGTGSVNGSIEILPPPLPGLPYNVPFTVQNDPNVITTFTYGGNLAFVFTLDDFITFRAETSYYFANLNYTESITVNVDDSSLPVGLPQTEFTNELNRNLNAGILNIRIGVGARF